MKKTIFILGLIPSLVFSQVAFASFSDVTEDTPYNDAIDWHVENGIIVGYEDGTFKPDRCVSRAEILKMIYFTLETNVDDPAADTGYYGYYGYFSDVDESEWYWPYVRFALQNETIVGYEDGTFKPGNCVNRAEAIKMATIEFDLVEEGAELSGYSDANYRDVDPSTWSGKYMFSALNKNLVGLEHTGIFNYSDSMPETFFYPADSMTRKEVAEMLYRMKVVKDNDLNLYSELHVVEEVEELVAYDISAKLEEGENIVEILNPGFTLPEDIHENQVNKFFELDEINFALVLQNSMNIVLDVPQEFEVSFVGVLIGNEDDEVWEKLLEVVDDEETDKNNPYYLWNEGEDLYLTVVDQNGAGSGEGVMKLFYSQTAEEWEVESCYYFGGNYNDPSTDGDYYEFSMNLEGQDEQPIEDCENVRIVTF